MLKHLLSTSIITSLVAFDNSNGWKLDADGHIVLKDGNPVYIESTGAEKTVAVDTISKLNAEAKEHRTGKEEAIAKLKAFEGLDPEVARKAIETVKNVDAKKLIDSGEVEILKAQMKSEFTAQLTEKDTALSALQNRLDNMMVSDVFSKSELVRNQLAVPADMFESTFRKNFKIEDGKLVAYDKAGNRLLSKERAGEYAEPEEALRLLVEAHPQKEVILKAQTGNGSGNEGGAGQRGGARTIKRADFEKLSPAAQAENAGKVRSGEIVLTD